MKNIAGEIDEIALLNELERNIGAVHTGDLSELKAMLMRQTKTLQTMFFSFAQRATGHTELKPYQIPVNMALKAQSQSCATIQTLVELKTATAGQREGAFANHKPYAAGNRGCNPQGQRQRAARQTWRKTNNSTSQATQSTERPKIHTQKQSQN